MIFATTIVILAQSAYPSAHAMLRRITAALRAHPLFNDVVAVSILGMLFIAIENVRLNFVVLSGTGLGHATARLLIVSSPVLLIYVALRLVFNPVASLVLCVTPLMLLAEASIAKQSLTNEPLVWTDVTTTSNYSIALKYATPMQMAVVVGLLALMAAALATTKYRVPRWRQARTVIGTLGLVAPVALYPWTKRMIPGVGSPLEKHMSRLGILYGPWDLAKSLTRNGLPLHLIQTSVRRIPPAPTADEHAVFASLSTRPQPRQQRPPNIIFVLCESCWHDAVYLREIFSPLRALGFQEFRTVSPTFGGNTVNASFELLTGLPAKSGVLTGAIYSEYADLFRHNALTYPQQLRSLGYNTIAAHNNTRRFWRRDLVNPKFGFERFISIEEMGYRGSDWADDSLLYIASLNALVASARPTFLFATTVYGHGPYPKRSDLGETAYAEKISVSVNRLTEFVEQVLAIAPSTAILVLGDHKPALEQFFRTAGVLSSGIESDPWEVVGDVPAYFYHSDTSQAREFIRRANGQAMYCLPPLLDELYTGVNLPSFAFVRENGLCSTSVPGSYNTRASAFPGFLYSLSLF